jgi:hypothetical protein
VKRLIYKYKLFDGLHRKGISYDERGSIIRRHGILEHGYLLMKLHREENQPDQCQSGITAGFPDKY